MRVCWRLPPHVYPGALDAAGWFHTGDLGRWEEAAADNDEPPGQGGATGGEEGLQAAVAVAGAAAGAAAAGAEVGGSRSAPRWRLRVVERLGFVVKLSNGEFLAPH